MLDYYTPLEFKDDYDDYLLGAEATQKHCTSDGVGQEGIGHSYQSAVIILVLPVVLSNRLNLHLKESQKKH